MPAYLSIKKIGLRFRRSENETLGIIDVFYFKYTLVVNIYIKIENTGRHREPWFSGLAALLRFGTISREKKRPTRRPRGWDM